MRIRHGSNEKKEFRKLVRRIKSFKFQSGSKETKRETTFTNSLYSALFQDFDIMCKKNLHEVSIAGEKYRPDLRLGQTTAIEVKFLRSNGHKGKFKEGLAQALVYGLSYKFVVLVLVDLTKQKVYHENDGRSDKKYSSLVNKLRKKPFNIEILTIVPKAFSN